MATGPTRRSRYRRRSIFPPRPRASCRRPTAPWAGAPAPVACYRTRTCCYSPTSGARAEAPADLRETYRAKLQGERSRAIEVVDLMFQNPVLVTNRIATELNVTVQSALNHLRRLESEGIVRGA